MSKKLVLILVLLTATGIIFSQFFSKTKNIDLTTNPDKNPPTVQFSDSWPLQPLANQPDIPNTAQAVLLIDYDQEKIIYEKNSVKQLPVASLSKIMTSLLALEILGENNFLRVDPEATACGESSMNLLAGERCSVKELTYGMILNSGNDAAEVVAQTSSQGGRNKFLDWMNQKARFLKLEQTSFVNPTGLDEDNGQTNLSSARDLAKLFHYAFQNLATFREIFTTQEYLAKGLGHRQLYLYNTGWKFSGNYPYLIGAKSGNTDQAGFCFLGLSEKNGRKILLIVLGEPDFNSIKKDSWNLFESGFQAIKI